MTPLSSAQCNGDIDEVVVTAACDEHPYRSRGKIIKDDDLDIWIGQQPRDPGLPRTTAPCLRNDPGRSSPSAHTRAAPLDSPSSRSRSASNSANEFSVRRESGRPPRRRTRWEHDRRPPRAGRPLSAPS
jgi:hypothetical protein